MQAVDRLPLLGEAERRQVLEEWNETEAEYPKEKCVHELFEEQVEKTPEAVAVVYEDEQLSYGELNRRANQLAHHLRESGGGAGCASGDLRGAELGDGGGAAGDAQGGRRLCAAGSGLSGWSGWPTCWKTARRWSYSPTARPG